MAPARPLVTGSGRMRPAAEFFAAQRLGARLVLVAELNCYSERVSFNGSSVVVGISVAPGSPLSHHYRSFRERHRYVVSTVHRRAKWLSPARPDDKMSSSIIKSISTLLHVHQRFSGYL